MDARNEKLSLNSDSVNSMIKAGIIREDYIQIKEGFTGSFDVIDVQMTEVNSFKSDEKINMPKFTFSNDKARFVVWGSTLLNAIVLKDYSIKTKPLAKANGLNVWFRDEFVTEFPNTRKISDLRNEDGGITIDASYKIVGALVSRSKVDETRWSIGFKLYERGTQFLEFERIRLNDAKLSWITEERIVEISKMDSEKRTYDGSSGKVTLPAFHELKTVGNATTDVRWAKATFIVEQI